jgi:hypothetical protein
MPRTVTIDQWFARQDAAVEAVHQRQSKRWEVRNLSRPASKKEKYIADLAMGVATGKSLATYPPDERRAVRAFLRRAGIRIPGSARKPVEPRLDPKAAALAKIEERMKQEEEAFVRAVLVARQIYRMTADGDSQYGKTLIERSLDLVPAWFKNKAKNVGVNITTQDNPETVPGYDLAYANTTQKLRERLMQEAGLA